MVLLGGVVLVVLLGGVVLVVLVVLVVVPVVTVVQTPRRHVTTLATDDTNARFSWRPAAPSRAPDAGKAAVSVIARMATSAPRYQFKRMVEGSRDCRYLFSKEDP